MSISMSMPLRDRRVGLLAGLEAASICLTPTFFSIHMPQTALVIIARDEERSIARCIDSVKDFVDEVLVLDTGSVDRTMEIARSCGAQVHRFEWCDDFAAARNRALDLADANWNLVLDADEWLVEGGAWLAGLPTMERQLGVADVQSLYEMGVTGAVSRSRITRLLPRGVRYQGVVHEQPASDLPRVLVPLVIRHDGYLPEQMSRKQGRNQRLLLQELSRNPRDAYINYQLGVDFELNRDFSKACAHYGVAMEQLEVSSGYEHDLCVRYLYCLGQAGRHEEGLALAQAQMPKWQDSPDFFFTLGGVLLDAAIAKLDGQVEHWLSMAQASWERCLEIGEVDACQHGGVAGRGSYLAAHNLAVMHEQLGNLDEARALRLRHPMPASGS